MAQPQDTKKLIQCMISIFQRLIHSAIFKGLILNDIQHRGDLPLTSPPDQIHEEKENLFHQSISSDRIPYSYEDVFGGPLKKPSSPLHQEISSDEEAKTQKI